MDPNVNPADIPAKLLALVAVYALLTLVGEDLSDRARLQLLAPA